MGGITDHYETIARCNRCGFCQVACPIFRATGHEAGVARGRIALLRAIVEGQLEWSPELKEPLFACLLCGACTANCFPAVPTADLLLTARNEYLDRVGRSSIHRLLFNHLLPHPGRLRMAARAAALGKRTGLARIAKALGLLRFLGRDFPRAEQIVDRFPSPMLRDRLKDVCAESEPSASRRAGAKALRVGYFVGCGMDLMCPAAGEASVRVLRGLGHAVRVLDNVCCGLPPQTYGDTAAAQRLAERNLPVLTSADLDVIVTDCASCAAFLKKYPTLFGPEHPLHEAARSAAGRVRDFVELAGAPAAGPEPVQTGERMIVTYHDPCHASRGQGITAEPRRLLAALANVEYRELPEADWCCGGSGSYALSHYDLSRKVLDRKIDNVVKTGANVLATSCPACIIHLSFGVRKRGLNIRVFHISQLLAEVSSSVPSLHSP